MLSSALLALPAWAAKSGEGDWGYYGGDAAATRYSPLQQIRRSNASKLKVAWTHACGDASQRPLTTIECTPIVVGTCPAGTTSTGATSCTPTPCTASVCCNDLTGACTIVYVVGGGSAYPHYLFLAAIEVVSLVLIIWYAWRWPAQEKTAAQLAM